MRPLAFRRVVLAGALLSACGGDATTTPSATPPVPAASPAATARYRVTPYDAGTDDGATYEAPDRDTQPRSAIGRLDDRPVREAGVVAPFGTFTFRRLP